MNILTTSKFKQKDNLDYFDIVNTGFKEVIRYFRVVDKDIPESQKVESILKIFYGDVQMCLNDKECEKCNKNCDKSTKIFSYSEINKISNKIKEHLNFKKFFNDIDEHETDNVKYMCYEKDDYLIYSAFKQIYGIDLIDENIHWFKFVSLLNGLPNTTKLSDIIDIRKMDIPKPNGNNAKQINDIVRAKKLYSIEEVDFFQQGLLMVFNQLKEGAVIKDGR